MYLFCDLGLVAFSYLLLFWHVSDLIKYASLLASVILKYKQEFIKTNKGSLIELVFVLVHHNDP